MKPARFSVYTKGYGDVQVRDSKAPTGLGGVVAVFPTIGGQWATYQTHVEALRLARKVARKLNGKA